MPSTAATVRVPQITSLETAIRLYYERIELSNSDIRELFGKLAPRDHQEPEKQGSGDNDRAKHSGLECSAREHGDSLRSMGSQHHRP